MSTRKSIKGTKNTPFIYDEVKKKHGIFLTPSSWEWLQEKAKSEGTSVSELIEQLVRERKTPMLKPSESVSSPGYKRRGSHVPRYS